MVEEAILIEMNSTIINSNSDEGGIFFGIDNVFSEIIFQNTIFYGNSAFDSLLSIENCIKVTFFNVTFQKNKNLLFAASFSNVYIYYSKIIDLECYNLRPACLAYFLDNSYLVLNMIYVKNVKHFNAEGGMRMIDSHLYLSNSNFYNLKTAESLSSCISGINSKFDISFISIIKYEFNCFYLQESSLNLTESLFDNTNDNISNETLLENKIKNIGTISCKNCLSFNVNHCVFSSNSYNIYEGGVILLSDLKVLNEKFVNNTIFVRNKVMNKGGAMLIFDTKLRILNSFFLENKAKEGGSIFYQGFISFLNLFNLKKKDRI